MADLEKRKTGGAKLTRTETVTVRLDPKLRYLAELAARKQRRTLSSYIEWAIEDSLRAVMLYQGEGYNGDDSRSVADEASSLWDVDDAERFMRLAINYPELLTHEEQQIWKLLSDSLLLSPAQRRRGVQLSWDSPTLEDVVFPEVRQRWPKLMMAYVGSLSERSEWVSRTRSEVAAGKVYSDVKIVGKTKPLSFDDMDDDIPF
jgi:hypothetical protein